MKGYGGWAQSEAIFTKQLNMSDCVFLSVACGRCAHGSCCGTRTWTNKWGTLQTFWRVIISKHFLWCSVCLGVGWSGGGGPELISHLLWFVAATRTVYCPCGWIEAVRRRKEQCWAKHQRYSQNVLRLPHTRTLFHLSINTPSKCRFRLKTNTEENLCTGLSTRSSETTLKSQPSILDHSQVYSGVSPDRLWNGADQYSVMCLGVREGITRLNPD